MPRRTATDTAHALVAGGRRLAAVRHLGWTEVRVTVAHLDTVEAILRGEEQENTCRLELTAAEGARGRLRREATYRRMGREEQERAGREHGRGQTAPPKLGEPMALDRRTAKLAAVGSGYSGSTLDKVTTIRTAAEAPTVRHGGRDVPVPEPVRVVAREAYAAVSQPGARVDAAHRRVEAALDLSPRERRPPAGAGSPGHQTGPRGSGILTSWDLTCATSAAPS